MQAVGLSPDSLSTLKDQLRGRTFHRASKQVRKLFRACLVGRKPNKKASSTLRTSQAVPHPSTDRAFGCLTSEFGWDRVCSTEYGRWRKLYVLKWLHPGWQPALAIVRGPRARPMSSSKSSHPRPHTRAMSSSKSSHPSPTHRLWSLSPATVCRPEQTCAVLNELFLQSQKGVGPPGGVVSGRYCM